MSFETAINGLAGVVKPFNLIGLDPGGTTGIAHSYYDGQSEPTIENFHYTTTDMDGQHHKALYEYLAFLGDRPMVPLTIVCEAFEFRQNLQKAKVELISREYIGVVKLISQQAHIKVVMQTASQGKHFVPDAKLERMGLLVTPAYPNRHKNDALRHVVRYQVARLGIRSPLTDSWRND